MKTQRWLTVLTAVNLALLGLIAAHARLPAHAAPEVYAADPDFRWENGRRGHPETVMLRLISSQGSPAVMLAAKEDGAGIVLGGARNPVYAALGAEDGVPKLRLADKDNKMLAITP